MIENKKLIEPFILDSIVGDVDDLINPIDLLSYNRLDLAFKLFYLEYLNKNNELAINTYSKHILSFGLGKAREYGNIKKNSIEQFLNDFNSINCNIKNCGFDSNVSIIPLATDGTIINGSHRLASSIFNNKKISTIKTNCKPHNYDYNFFRRRGIDSNTLDGVVKTFVKYDSKSYIAIIWPSANKYLYHILSKINNIVYIKNISLSYTGMHNFISQVYRNEKWLGSFADGYSGIKNKLNECYKDGKNTTAVIFQSDNFDNVIELKNYIRNFCQLDKHSIHITDGYNDNLKIIDLLLNNNSHIFLNQSNFTKYKKNELFINYLNSFKDSNNDIIFDGGIVLSMLGLREYNDIDYMSVSDIESNSGLLKLNNHNDQLQYYNIKLCDLLYDQKYFFSFSGFKFVDISYIYKMKKNRSLAKDIIDCRLIKLKNNSLAFFIQLILLKVSYLNLKIYFLAYTFFKFLGLIPILKKILRKK